jgi:hypothetical protein
MNDILIPLICELLIVIAAFVGAAVYIQWFLS